MDTENKAGKRASSTIVILASVCLYGFIKEIRPTTTFLTDHLVDDKHFSKNQTYGDIYPILTYSKTAFLIPVFILSDLLRYKPIILTESLAYIACWVLITWGTTLGHMQVMQVFFAWGTSARIAYQTYIYGAVRFSKFKKATSLISTATLLGKCTSYATAQVLVSVAAVSYYVLDYITLGTMAFAFLICCFFPTADFVWRSQTEAEEGSQLAEAGSTTDSHVTISRDPVLVDNQTRVAVQQISIEPVLSKELVLAYFRGLYGKIRRAYSNPVILKWSIWWAISVCGHDQIGNTIQNLWKLLYDADEQRDRSKLRNGIVGAANTLLGAGIAYSAQYVRINFEVIGEAVLAIISAITCGALIFISQTHSLTVAYAGYVIIYQLYQLLVVICAYVIASKLRESSYGLIFGCNTWIALLLESLLAFLVTDSNGPFNLSERNQYAVYGSCYGVVSLLFAVMAIKTISSAGWRNLPRLMKQPADEDSSAAAAVVVLPVSPSTTAVLNDVDVQVETASITDRQPETAHF